VTTKPRPKPSDDFAALTARRNAALREYIESGQFEKDSADDPNAYRAAIVQLGYPPDYKPDEARPPRVIWTYWKWDNLERPIYRTDRPDMTATVYEIWNASSRKWDRLGGGSSVSDYLFGEGGAGIDRMTDQEVSTFLADEPEAADNL